MTRLEKEFDEIISTLMYPARYAKSFVNHGGAYPPYNILKVSDNETVLEIAVAGFGEDEVSVSVDAENLKVIGTKNNIPHNEEYLYKGIATRAFEKSFALSKDAKVEKAEYADGILSVFVTYEFAEAKKTKDIPISRGSREYLTEADDIVK